MRKFTPIAMRCTKEQFEAVESKIPKKYLKFIGGFNNAYLINNWCGVENSICTMNQVDQHDQYYKRTVHETWNEKIFLEACGIEIDTFEITKETILKYQMKDEFPEVFDVKLEVGKWYVFESGTIGFFKGVNIDSYGFHSDSKEWFPEHKWFHDINLNYFNSCRLATIEEVEQTLIKEAEKRGYREGVCLRYPWFKGSELDKIYKPIFDVTGDTYFDGDSFYYNDIRVFKDGIWAEIIPIKQMTQEEIEKELGYKIEIV